MFVIFFVLQTSIDEGSADKKSSSVKKEAVPPKVTKKQQKTPPGSEGASHAMPPINGHAISTNTKYVLVCFLVIFYFLSFYCDMPESSC